MTKAPPPPQFETVRDSFRKSPRGGKNTSEDIWGGGGGVVHVQWAVFNFKGSNSQGGGGHKVLKGGE